MMNLKKLSLSLVFTGLLMAQTTVRADIVEAFTGGQLSTPGWSNGIGADASIYLSTAAPDATYGIALSESQWSYNTNISFLPGETLSAWINPGPTPTADNNAQGGRLFVGFDAGANGAQSFVAASDTSQLGFQDNTGYATPNFSNSVAQTYQDQWYYLTIALSADGSTATASLYDMDGKTLLSSLTETGLSAATDNGIALRGSGAAAITSIAITAVPVPGAIWMFASAMGLFGFVAKRRKTNLI